MKTKLTFKTLFLTFFLLIGSAIANDEGASPSLTLGGYTGGIGTSDLMWSGLGPYRFNNSLMFDSTDLKLGGLDDSEYGSGALLFPSSSPFSLTSSFSTGLSFGNPFLENYDPLTFGSTVCRSFCDTEAWNCGWGFVSDSYSLSQIEACGGNKNWSPTIVETSGVKKQLICEIGGEVTPVDVSLDSLKDLIGYDCSNLKELGNGPYCHCILNKSADPSNSYYTPLTDLEVDSLESMVKLDKVQTKVRELNDELENAAMVLSSALGVQDEDIQNILKENRNASCQPGNLQRLEGVLKTVQEDGNSLCGDRGFATLNRVFNLNELDDKRRELVAIGGESGAKPGDITSMLKDPDLGSMLTKLNGRVTNYVESHYGFNKETTAGMHSGRVSAAEALSTPCLDSPAMQAAAAAAVAQSSGPAGQNQSPVQLSHEHVMNSFCGTIEPMIPSMSYDYARDLATIMRKYRELPEDKRDPIVFVDGMKSDHNMTKLKNAIAENYTIIDQGIIKHNIDGKNWEAALIKMLDETIGKNVDGEDPFSGPVAHLTAKLDEALGKVQRNLLDKAVNSCNKFVDETAKICQELGNSGTKLEDEDFESFIPARATRFAESPELHGSLKGIESKALYRKFSQLKCARIIGNEDLKQKAYADDSSGDGMIGPPMPLAMDIMTAFEEKNNITADRTPASEVMGDASQVAEVLSRSTDANMRGAATSIREEARRELQRAIADKSKSIGGNGVKGNYASQFEKDESNPNMDAVAKAAGETLGASIAANSNNNSVSSSFINGLSDLEDDDLDEKKEEIAKEKEAAESRLDVIAKRLADLMEAQAVNKAGMAAKEESLSPSQREDDPEYQQMLIEKLKLERELALLNKEKTDAVASQERAKQQLAAVESEQSVRTGTAVAGADGAGDGSIAASNTSTNSGGGTGSSRRRAIASIGSVNSAGGGGGGSITSSGENGFFESAPYVITLTQDQVSAIKSKFQVVEDPTRWVPGGKPPVIRDGNIFYELEVRDGKIVLDEFGKPKIKQALNGFNVAGLRKPASREVELPKEVDVKDVRRRRAARVRELNAILDGK